MENGENLHKRDETTARIIEQNKQLRIENNDLLSQLDALKNELKQSKEQSQKNLLDLAKTNRKNKELQAENQQLLAQLSQLEKDFNSLNIPAKDGSELQEPDFGPRSKASRSHSTHDAKTLNLIREFESQKEKLEEENASLQRELHTIKEQFKNQGNFTSRDLNSARGSKEISSKFYLLENEYNVLVKENEVLKNKIDNLNLKLENTKEEGLEYKTQYDELRSKLSQLEQITPSKSISTRYNDIMDLTPISENNRYGKSISNNKGFFPLSPSKPEDSIYHSMNYGELTDLTTSECKKLISDILASYNIKSPKDLMPAIKKTEKVMKAVPKLQKLVSDIARLVLPRAGYAEDGSQLDRIVPIIKKWLEELKGIDELVAFREKITELLHVKKSINNSEILKKVDQLANISFQAENSERGNEIKEQFAKIFKVNPDKQIFKQLAAQVSDLNEILEIAAKKFGLEGSKRDAIVKHIIGKLENDSPRKEVSQSIEIVHKLQKMLSCRADLVLEVIENLIERRGLTSRYH